MTRSVLDFDPRRRALRDAKGAFGETLATAREKVILDELARVCGIDPRRVSVETMRSVADEIRQWTD